MMVTVCGALAAPGAATVMWPPSVMLSTCTCYGVSSCRCEPFCGLTVYNELSLVALHVRTPPPLLITVKSALARMQMLRWFASGATDSWGEAGLRRYMVERGATLPAGAAGEA
jgi:hypothetical protein